MTTRKSSAKKSPSPLPPPRLFIGLMSGTSVDAIDAALVRITTLAPGRYAAKVLHHTERPWPAKLRARLLAVMAPATTTTQEISDLHTRVAELFAATALACLAESQTPARKITALASHGQTIAHFPATRKNHIGSTLQIGSPSILSTLTGITTVADFRPADIAVHGQGAPLVPFADSALLTHDSLHRCIQNIGGIANVTYLPPSNLSASPRRPVPTSVPPVLAFDTGPGNMLLDALISLSSSGKQRFDKSGHLAAAGSLDTKLFRQLQAHPYFTKRPPKSTGREDFGLPLAKQLLAENPSALSPQSSALATLIHTATRLTAWSIADAYLHFLPQLPDEVILCGGGADNPALISMLTEEFAALTSPYTHPTPPKIRRIDDFGIPNKSKEAASFALLAAATLDNQPANLPSVTGATRPTLLGLIAPARPNSL